MSNRFIHHRHHYKTVWHDIEQEERDEALQRKQSQSQLETQQPQPQQSHRKKMTRRKRIPQLFVHSCSTMWSTILVLIIATLTNSNNKAMIMMVDATSTATSSSGIPGTTQTENGYDTEMGTDAICWSSVASPTPEDGIPFPNGALVEDYALADQVELLRNCPTGTTLEAYAPKEFQSDSILRVGTASAATETTYRPTTKTWYNYTVSGSLDMTYLNGKYIAADKGSRIAISIIACKIGTAGFCSPFVHEQANLREAAEKEAQQNARRREQEEEEEEEAPTKPKKVPGFSHGGTHVHARAVILELPESQQNFTFAFDVEVPMIVNDPDTFFLIGTLQFFTGDSPVDPMYRYDVSNAIQGNQRLVHYQPPPTIKEVSEYAQHVSYVVVSMACAVILFLLFHTIRYYQAQVLQISQVPFLVLYLLCALMATACSILTQPQSDLWCNLSHPLILIPLQIMYGITLGRLWRIHAVISPLLRRKIETTSTNRRNKLRQRIHDWNIFMWLWDHIIWPTLFRYGGFREASQKGNIRREVSSTTVTIITILCTLPQVVIQVLAWWLQPQVKSIQLNEDQSIGRCVCDDGRRDGASLRNYGLLTLFFLVVLVIIMAHSYRHLPSLLNESTIIYNATLSSFFLYIMGAGITVLTDQPTTTPDIPFMINTLLILSITINGTVRTMMPKLHMAWKGETILVHQLVQDHRQSLNRSSDASTKGQQGRRMSHISGLDEQPPSSFMHRTSISAPISSRKQAWDFAISSDNLEDDDEYTDHSGTYNSGSLHETNTTKHAATNATTSTTVRRYSSTMSSEIIEEETEVDLGTEHDEEIDLEMAQNRDLAESGQERVDSIRQKHRLSATSSQDVWLQSIEDSSNHSDTNQNNTDDNVDQCHSAIPAENTITPTSSPRVPRRSKRRMQNMSKPIDIAGISTTNSTVDASDKGSTGSGRFVSFRAETKGDEMEVIDPEQQCIAQAAAAVTMASFQQPKKRQHKSKQRQKKKAKAVPKKFIKIRPNEIPNRHLVLNMMDLKNELDHIMDQIMSGYPVDLEEWKAVESRTEILEKVFRHVDYEDWKDENDSDDNDNTNKTTDDKDSKPPAKDAGEDGTEEESK